MLYTCLGEGAEGGTTGAPAVPVERTALTFLTLTDEVARERDTSGGQKQSTRRDC